MAVAHGDVGAAGRNRREEAQPLMAQPQPPRANPRSRRLSGRIRVTRQGEAIDDVLRAADGFRTAQDLYGDLRGQGLSVGLTTVYRHLKVLADAGEIDVVHRPDGEAQYRLCRPTAADRAGGQDHHHHLVCRVCGRAVEVDGPEVEDWAERVAAAAGYTQISHTVEVFGLCPEHSA
jgi:Fur family transcriptional regulator, ferric uptake regulator